MSIYVDGRPYRVPDGASIAAALLLAGISPMRVVPAGGAARSPFCMIGVCFECLIEIDGVRDQQGCQVPVREGMSVHRQMTARTLL